MWQIPVDAMALLVLGAGLGNPSQLMGPLYTTMHLRNVHGNDLTAAVRTPVFAGVFVALAALLSPADPVLGPAATAAWQIPSALMMAVMIRILARCLYRLERSRAMSDTLARSAGDMLTADAPEQIRELTVRAAAELAPDATVAILPPAVTVEAGADVVGHHLVLPLRDHGRNHGTLTITSTRTLSQQQHQSLQTLSSHAIGAFNATELRSQLDHRANHDALTELPNRALFTASLTRAMVVPGQRAAVVFIDLDEFKWVNDNLGHDAGDVLLIEVAARLRSAIRTTDLPARLGGDEFAVLIDNVVSTDDACRIAERLLRLLEEPVSLGGHEYRIKCSIGVALSSGASTDLPAAAQAHHLVKKADLAMYEAKNSGKNQYKVFRAPAEVA
jgi:diguanylate cyclase (GGDEF)-like protein